MTAHELDRVWVAGGDIEVICRCGWMSVYCKTLHDAADEFQDHQEQS